MAINTGKTTLLLPYCMQVYTGCVYRHWKCNVLDYTHMLFKFYSLAAVLQFPVIKKKFKAQIWVKILHMLEIQKFYCGVFCAMLFITLKDITFQI